MTNAEKYKTAYERLKAHREMCRRKNGCNCIGDSLCLLKWLEQEAEEKLLPCPFCGSKDINRTSYGFNYSGYMVACTNCNSCSIANTRREAVERWNRRAK